MNTDQSLSNLRVMIVEDDASVAKLLRMVLKELGARLEHTAEDGAQALRFIGENEGRINTIISDWNMPQMNGMELLRQIRTVDSTIQFMMITGRATSETVMEARALHVNAFVPKPFEPEVIRLKLVGIANDLRQLALLGQLSHPT